MSAHRILLVSSDEGLRADVGGWLEAQGHDLMECPGPRYPEYGCVGVRGGLCALKSAAEVCILDLHPAGSDLVDRTTRTDLIRLYAVGGRPVVVLVDGEDFLNLEPMPGVAVLDRTVDTGILAGVLEELAPRVQPLP